MMIRNFREEREIFEKYGDTFKNLDIKYMTGKTEKNNNDYFYSNNINYEEIYESFKRYVDTKKHSISNSTLEFLGLNQNSTKEEIKKSIKIAIIKYHPDTTKLSKEESSLGFERIMKIKEELK